MKKADIRIGGQYQAKVSGKLTTVRIDYEATDGGWMGTNLSSGHSVMIKTAARLRKPIGIAPTTSIADFWTQWQALKARDPGSILLFRQGDYYEAYADDAVKVAGVLGRKLFVRIDGYSEVDGVSIEHESLGHSLVTLAECGYRVAVCEQVDGPSPAGRTVVVPVPSDDELLDVLHHKDEITEELIAVLNGL